MSPIIIVGGGLSGLAAGVFLSRRSHLVVVLEQKPFPGGRAYSFTDAVTGEMVDNGQHVLIAGYVSTMRFLEMLGTRNLLRIHARPQLLFHHPAKGFRRLQFPAFPAPMHFGAGILASDLFSLTDRLRLLRAGWELHRLTPAREAAIREMSVREWLIRAGQSGETMRSLWEPLAVSVMNEHIGTASALLFIRSLRRAFLGHRNAAAMAIPAVGLSKLYVEAAVAAIHERGGSVRCGADVAEIQADERHVSGVRVRGGSLLDCRAVILAVPSDRVRALLPRVLTERGYLQGVDAIPVSPIISVHLWFERDFMAGHDVVGLIDRTVQWLFNKRAGPSHHRQPGGHVSAVISAAREHVGKRNDELTEIVLADIRSAYGKAVTKPVHGLVIREKRATFSSSPSVERIRPDQQTPLSNLFLAGDWTATGLPATLEGAVMSAERSADLAGRIMNTGGQ